MNLHDNEKPEADRGRFTTRQLFFVPALAELRCQRTEELGQLDSDK